MSNYPLSKRAAVAYNARRRIRNRATVAIAGAVVISAVMLSALVVGLFAGIKAILCGL